MNKDKTNKIKKIKIANKQRYALVTGITRNCCWGNCRDVLVAS